MGKKKLKILVGDDQIGVIGDNCNLTFLDNYGHLADYDFAATPEECIKMAYNGNYDTLITDLCMIEPQEVDRDLRFLSKLEIAFL
ncbi:hypothetical protein J4456_03605 [Candidatus Pacearchaeota archaeon]|nr:hypothetical protein [Candidatus Pacearchaeota archaeon]